MTERYFPFDAGAGASVTEDDWARMARVWARSGVIPSGTTSTARTASDPSLKATVAASLTWTLPVGSALVDGCGYNNDANLTRTAANNTNSSARIDRLVLRLDRSANTITATVLLGTPGSGSPPALSATATVVDLPLFRATAPGSGSSQIYGSLVDERPFTGGQVIAQPNNTSGLILPGDLIVRTDQQTGIPYLRGTDGADKVMLLGRGANLDVFDGAAWRGTRRLIYDTTVFADLGVTNASYVTLATLAIADPGYSYRLVASGTTEWFAGIGTRYDLFAKVGAQDTGEIISGSIGHDGGAAGLTAQIHTLPGISTVQSGAKTAVLVAQRVYGPAGNGIDPSAFGRFHVEVSPA